MNITQRHIAYAFILILGLIWIFASADQANVSTAGKIPAPQKGFLAPDFELNTLDGNTLRLSNLRGQAVLINFWATWCLPCRAEMPTLEKIYQEYKGQGLVVLAVNMTYQDAHSNIAAFVEEYDLTYPILLDENNVVGFVYQVRSLPASFFIDREGIIRDVIIGGPMAEALLRTRVEEVLK
ncbi:MAG TPA: TlpA disulfide reductase family protein [Anaerolineales bacterium]|nr:TlpA disulfide reductase family protein [Anaerolineales bacterium]